MLLAAVPSLLITALSVQLIRSRAPRWGLMAQPRADRFHDRARPLGGGVAIWLGVVGTFVLLEVALWLFWTELLPRDLLPPLVSQHLTGLWQQSAKLWVLLGSGTIMMILGLSDDRWGLDWRVRLCVQTIVAAGMVWQGWRLTLFLDWPILTGPLSVLWIVGIVNAFNLLDNMDGLAAGVAWIAVVLLAAVMLLAPDPQTHGPQLFVAGFLIVVAGALASFWCYNWSPAKIFMGDAGSYFVGFCLATATLMATFAGGNLPTHALFAPLCLLAVPIYDTTTVVSIRLRQGRSPFQGDRNHFSHRLVELGFSPRQAVATIYLLTAACGLGALLLHQVDARGAAVILLMILAMLSVVAILEHVASGGWGTRNEERGARGEERGTGRERRGARSEE